MSKELALTTVQTERLAELESIIEAGQKTFLSVSAALMEIQATKLYRQTHKTFAAYLEERWQIGKSQGYNLIAAGEVVNNVSAVGIAPPQTEAQARPLVGHEPQVQQQAMQKANDMALSEGKPLTARHVQEAVGELMPQPKVPQRPGATGKSSKPPMPSAPEPRVSSKPASSIGSFDPGADADPDDHVFDFEDARDMHAVVGEWLSDERVSGGGRQRAHAAETLRAIAAWIERQG